MEPSLESVTTSLDNRTKSIRDEMANLKKELREELKLKGSWLLTSVARVRARVRSCGICDGHWHWSGISPSTSVSSANLHSTNCSTATTIYHLGLVQ
jgi:hypothetical protein